MVDELIKSVKENILERLASPLLGSFAVFWCLFNYKFLIVLFSKSDVTQTFAMMDSLAYTDDYDFWLRRVIYPALFSLAYVFGYPHVARFVYKHLLQQQQKSNNARLDIEKDEIIPRAKVDEMRARHIEEKETHRAWHALAHGGDSASLDEDIRVVDVYEILSHAPSQALP